MATDLTGAKSQDCSRGQVLLSSIENLHPVYFAMVMATGIVAVASHLMEMDRIALMLTVLNIAMYICLWVMTLARIVLYPRRFLLDLIDHGRGVGFFTTVAGTCVLGTQFVVIVKDYTTATILWYIGMGLWAALTYTVFAAFTVKEKKPTLAEGINGGWLVVVVATQAVSNLAGLLLPCFPEYEEPVIFLALSFWLCGGMLYIWIISLIFYRYTFFSFAPSDLNPPYWINMGAMAISTLAGTRLIINAPHSHFLQELLPFLHGFTIFFWATATWWIPMLVILSVWRHVYKRFKFSYDPLYWGAVFPLGMYTACTFQLAQVTHLPFLFAIPRLFIYIALAAWILIAAAFVRELILSLYSAGQRQPVCAT